MKFLNIRDASALLGSRDTIAKLNNDSVGLGHCEKLSVDQHLTPYVSSLAYKCRCLKRASKIVKTKVERETVKILINNESYAFKWFDILHVDDINNLIPDHGIVN